MASVLPTLELKSDEDNATAWNSWLERFKLYLVATETNKKDEKIQVAQLLHFAGPDLYNIYKTIQFAEGERDSLEAVIGKLNRHFEPKANITYNRYIFFNTRQSGQSLENFVINLKSQANKCQFGDLKDDLVKCMLICGINNGETRQKLLQEDEMTLEKAINLCKVMEQTRDQARSIENRNKSDVAPVDRINTKFSGGSRSANTTEAKGRSRDRRTPTSRTSTSKTRSWSTGRQQQNHNQTTGGKLVVNCSRCGSTHQINQCPAFGKECYKCKKKNHFGIMCRKYNNRQVNSLQQSGSDSENSLYVGSIDNVGAGQTSLNISTIETWYTKLLINNVEVNFKLDTGAMVNILSLKTFNNLKIPQNVLKPTSVTLKAYTGDNVNVIGVCNIKCMKDNRYHDVEFYVVNSNAESLLGLTTCTDLNLIKRVDSLDNDEAKIKISLKYPDLFAGIGKLKKPYHIKLKENVTPVISPIRKVPLALMKPLENTLNELMKNNIIEKVEGASDWVNPLVLVKKSNGSLRICLDPKHLNKAIKREHIRFPTFEEITSKLSDSRVYSVIDASQAFYQVVLDEESSKLCTFGTPFGRFKFLRLPYGVSSAPEVFSERFGDIFNFNNVCVYIDDIIVWGKTQKEHDEALKKVLEAARQNGIKFNLNKCTFSKTEVKFMGHNINKDGIKVDYSFVKAIKEFPTPKNKKDVQRLLGILNYVSKYIPNFSSHNQPLRNLLKKDIHFTWDDNAEKSLQEIKNKLTNSPVLQFFDLNKEITVSADASETGLGACLMQNNLPCLYASKALTQTQINYAQIEKELLAVWFALSKFHDFVYGREVTVETDHKPLLGVVTKPLHKCPARLQRILIQLQKYQFNLKYKRGKDLVIADTLSRSYLGNVGDNCEWDDELNAQVCLVRSQINVSDPFLKLIQDETLKDDELIELTKVIKNGWPNNSRRLNDKVKKYCHYKNDLTINGDIIYKGQCLLIPYSLRENILNKIHYSHLGTNKCIQLARESVFWPGITNEIKQRVDNCSLCQKYMHSQKAEPIIAHDIKPIPWYKVGCDIFELNKCKYLLVVDYYSKYVELEKLSYNTTSCNVVNVLKSLFARHGIPYTVVTDGGPQFTSSTFKSFAEMWNFNHVTSSPLYSQSNGMVERHIQTVKRLLKKAMEDDKDIFLALLQYRNIPVINNFSPAQILMSRQTRQTLLPTNTEKLVPKLVNNRQLEFKMKQRVTKQSDYYNRRQGVKELEPLHPGTNAQVQLKPHSTWTSCKVVTRIGKRRYKIKTYDDKYYVRNRRYIRPSVIKADYEQNKLCKKVRFANNTEVNHYDLVALRNPLNLNQSSSPGLDIEGVEDQTGSVNNEIGVSSENLSSISDSSLSQSATSVSTTPKTYCHTNVDREKRKRLVSRTGRPIIKPKRLDL